MVVLFKIGYPSLGSLNKSKKYFEGEECSGMIKEKFVANKPQTFVQKMWTKYEVLL